MKKSILIIGNGTLGSYTRRLLSLKKTTHAINIKTYDLISSKSDFTAKEKNEFLTVADEVYYCVNFSFLSQEAALVEDLFNTKRLLKNTATFIIRTTLSKAFIKYQEKFDAYWPAFETEETLQDTLARPKTNNLLIGLSVGVTVLPIINRLNFKHVTNVETAVPAKLAVNNAVIKTTFMIQESFAEKLYDILDKDLITTLVFDKLKTLDYVTPYVGGSCLLKDLELSSPDTSWDEYSETKNSINNTQSFEIYNAVCEVKTFLKNKTNFVLVLRGVLNHANDTTWHRNEFLHDLIVAIREITKPKVLLLSDLLPSMTIPQHTEFVNCSRKLHDLKIETDTAVVDDILFDSKNNIVVIDLQPRLNNQFLEKRIEHWDSNPRLLHLKLYSGH